VCSNRKLHEIAAYLNLVTPPTDDVEDAYSSEFLLELLVICCQSLSLLSVVCWVQLLLLLFCHGFLLSVVFAV